ncbi:glycoside hydrolase family 2 TIM barrel-domain containing protein [Rubrivirga sp. IMCC45206]|uniref:glycoside hydrolase family 2 TIM barrel-domain containing protein n=1 Tax=Rubrivirga sp. IMCC45206 TaxID=3391614 RepID=UPI00398FE773
MRVLALPLLVALVAVGPARAQTVDRAVVDRPGSSGVITSDLRTEGAIPVELRQGDDGSWTMYRGGEPYYIRGVGGHTYLDRAAAYGANSIRTWGAGDAIAVLDRAHELGLSVTFGLWAGTERQGFDYNDGRAVAAQLARFTEVVRTYKDHPAILMWGVGNENDLFYSNFKVWDALGDIAEMIHREDPNHPVMHVTAGLDVAEVQLIKERAPAIDVYGVNTYGELVGGTRQFRDWGYQGSDVGVNLRRAGWDGPYVIAEWGPDGHWEVPKTAWGVPVEQTSREKAEMYRFRYERGIAADTTHAIGSYVFLWGDKQETTPTWYGVFTPGGFETEVMDELQHLWTGTWPDNRAPRLETITANGQDRFASVFVDARAEITFDATVIDPDGDALRYVWELLPESTDIRAGGDAEARPDAMPFRPLRQEAGTLAIRAPSREGPYRMFLYAYDGNGNVATANLPFHVGRPAQ